LGPTYDIVVLLLLFFGVILAGIALVVMLLMTKLMKTRIKAKQIATTAAVFLLLFSASTLAPREKREGATLHFLGPGPAYVGQETKYGFPLPWVSTFSTYDNATTPLFFLPYDIKTEAFLIDFVLWAAISTISVNAIVIARNRRLDHLLETTKS